MRSTVVLLSALTALVAARSGPTRRDEVRSGCRGVDQCYELFVRSYVALLQEHADLRERRSGLARPRQVSPKPNAKVIPLGASIPVLVFLQSALRASS